MHTDELLQEAAGNDLGVRKEEVLKLLVRPASINILLRRFISIILLRHVDGMVTYARPLEDASGHPSLPALIQFLRK